MAVSYEPLVKKSYFVKLYLHWEREQPIKTGVGAPLNEAFTCHL
jgi:hypothetical protein